MYVTEYSFKDFLLFHSEIISVAKIKSDNITTRKGKEGYGNRTILSTLDSCKGKRRKP